ncbi:MAG: HsdR family type I site-specific deoxyribonuclease [Bifidobacteriaceae bacterium]|jgi:type I restriction enzyme R subunit|nr:HsdR family type I site-specific deoxyribonuclease [Bifidobacteriaceae bacterium]
MASESEFEDQLIQYLQTVGNTKQWTYVPQIKTIEQLWDNFKRILERNNQDKLGSNPTLSTQEFAQVRKVITDLRSPYDAGRFLYGMNGVTQVEVNRDEVDPATGTDHIFLTIFDQDQVGAGNTVYQIANQIEMPAYYKDRKDRRYDVTLLINGLPIIQIEEKAEGHDAKEALNQMHQYIAENLYSGIFSTLQILVGMTPYDARYMANTDTDSFNEAFAFRWQREDDSKPVYDWREFVSSMLSIPMAHEMSTRYMILDGARSHKRLMVMRPYQVYATRRVLDALKKHDFSLGTKEIGYVWHTTGSGKTVSSFKTAWLASRLPNVSKVVFVVDRVALTSQTYENYIAYDPDTDDENNGGVVSDSSNTGVLAAKLRSKQRKDSIIVTSIQKLGKLAAWENFNAPDQNIVFIVDEAHRSTNGDMLPAIKKRFPKSAWVGYTGTPVFEEELTRKAFGNLIHAYTIREAITDHNVLGFNVDFERTLGDSEIREKLLPEVLSVQYPQWTNEQIDSKIARIEPEEVDRLIDSGVYDENPDHVTAVVKNIIGHWKSRSVRGKYSALLTTHEGGNKTSARMALQYFDEFQRVNNELVERGEQPLAVAVTFSWSSDNSDGQLEKNEGLRRAMKFYNEAFGTSFDDKTVDQYFADVTARLAGKVDGPKLDIVIVIDQLLTGFDAPMVNTLYVDRTLSGASLIQAYSRTNRIHAADKPWGTIVNYRWPETSKRLMDQALKVYSNRNSADSQDSLPIDDGSVIAEEFSAAVVKTREIVNEIAELTGVFEEIPPSENAQEQLMKAIQQYNSKVAALKQYKDFDYDHPEELLKKLGITKEQETWMTTTAWYQLRDTDVAEKVIDLSDLDFHVESVMEVKVNYDYLEDLLAQLLNEVNEGVPAEQADETLARLNSAADQLEDRRLAEQVKSTASSVRSGTTRSGSYPATSHDAGKTVHEYSEDSKRQEILKFKREWGLVDVIMANELINAMIKRHVPNKDDFNLAGELMELTKEASEYYKTDAESSAVREFSKVKYHNKFREAFKAFADRLSQKY